MLDINKLIQYPISPLDRNDTHQFIPTDFRFYTYPIKRGG